MNKETLELIAMLTNAIKTGNQELINHYAFKLTNRLYIPNKSYTFDETLKGFGYKEIKEDPRQITIEEYMRGRKNDK